MHFAAGESGPKDTTAPDASAAHLRAMADLKRGQLLAAYLAIGSVLVIRRPHLMSKFCGGLLMFSIAANAVVMFNHPLLVESLDAELAAPTHGPRRHASTIRAPYLSPASHACFPRPRFSRICFRASCIAAMAAC